MSLVVKICGLSTEEAVDAALSAGADMLGFVFFPPSPRAVDTAWARHLMRRAPQRAETVALVVDADDALVAEVARMCGPDWFQLHGSETPERVDALRAMTGARIMKALPVDGRPDPGLLAAYGAVSDRILFDAKPPKDADRPGGHGRVFDWRLLDALGGETPYMISGGLDAGNVGEAVATSRAMGVDVSSGVETAPGAKDAGLIRDFLAAARRAEGSMVAIAEGNDR